MDEGGDSSETLVRHLKDRGISDPAVLAAMAAVPRNEFVGPKLTESAYFDVALPIACGQTISQPFVVAYMTEKLGVRAEHDVLEIGTGSGYQAAVLARLARHVFTIERHEALYEEAKARFERLGLANISVLLGDGTKGWPEARQFNRIIVTAAARDIPAGLTAQLKEGGRMILPLGKRSSAQRLVLVEKKGGDLLRQELLPVRFVPLLPDRDGT